MGVTFRRVKSEDQVQLVARLASIIWPEHYTAIIGAEQVSYMLGTHQSASAISDEIEKKGYQYYLAYVGDEPIGYLGVKLEHDSLFLSKLYFLARERGKGLGKKAIGFLRKLASSHNLHRITLTVNKHNSGSITAYEKIGFRITGKVCIDIGGGFVMDDYQMELAVQAGSRDCGASGGT